MSERAPIPAHFGNPILETLAEVQLPDPVGLWPTAPGWTYVWLVLSVCGLFWLARYCRYWWRNRYRRSALRRLAEIESVARQPLERLQALAVLLKATALEIYPRPEIAGLHGRAWTDFLNDKAGFDAFDEVAVEILSTRQYRDGGDIDDADVSRLIESTRSWLQRHPVVVPRDRQDRSG